MKELSIYIVQFDRAGYGESDPNPKKTVKSEAFDIQELADKLHLGPKFYVIGVSMGAYPVYGCLEYIPNRWATYEWLGSTWAHQLHHDTGAQLVFINKNS